MRSICFFVFCILTGVGASGQHNGIIRMLYTSDAHYGLHRKEFRGQQQVDAALVNAAMINSMNALPETILPGDEGVLAGKKLGGIDFVVQSGDIANRMEAPIQSASKSWQQFRHDYIEGLQVHDATGAPAKLLLLPGNHDISNAIGHFKGLQPAHDASVMIAMYNMMISPVAPADSDHYNHYQQPIHYAFNRDGIHFLFVQLWPDSAERVWMERDLDTVPATMPVLVFTHDQPECEAKHFTNPVPPHGLDNTARFENLLTEMYKENTVLTKGEEHATVIEQRAWVAFLRKHRNIKAYFHGNSNFNEFYIYKGPDGDVSLPVFRVDSPIKGEFSSKDETRLSYQVITIDTHSRKMTVRECLWNTTKASAPAAWGTSLTIPLD